MDSMYISLSYKEKGIITTKNVTESKYMFFDFMTIPEKVSEYSNEFTTAFKQAMKTFSSKKIYDVELRLESDNGAYFLVCQNGDDYTAGVYTVYDYATKNATNILKMSKQAIIERFNRIVSEVLTSENLI